jgi:hypothetical protein
MASEIPIISQKEAGESPDVYRRWGSDLLISWTGFNIGDPYTSSISPMEGRFRFQDRSICWLDGEGHFAYKLTGSDEITGRSEEIERLEKSAIGLSQWATTARLVGISLLVGTKILWYIGDVKVPLIGGPITPAQWGMAAGLLELRHDSPGPWLVIPALIHTFASGQRFLGLNGLLVGGSFWAAATGTLTFLLHKNSRSKFAKAYELREEASSNDGWRMWQAMRDGLNFHLHDLRAGKAVDTAAIKGAVKNLLHKEGEFRRTYGLLVSNGERTQFEDLIRYCRRLERFFRAYDEGDHTREIRRQIFNGIAIGDKMIPITTTDWHSRLLRTIGDLRRGQNEGRLRQAIEAARKAFDHTYISDIGQLQLELGDDSWAKFLAEVHLQGDPDTALRTLLSLGSDGLDDWEARLDLSDAQREQLAQIADPHQKKCKVVRWNLTSLSQDASAKLSAWYPDQAMGLIAEKLGLDDIARERQEALESFQRNLGRLEKARRSRADYKSTLDSLAAELGAVHKAEQHNHRLDDERDRLEAEITRVTSSMTAELDIYEHARAAIARGHYVISLRDWARNGNSGDKPQLEAPEEIDQRRAERAWTVAKYFESDGDYRDLDLGGQLRDVEEGLISPKEFYETIDGLCAGKNEKYDDFWLAANLYHIAQQHSGVDADSNS